MNPNPQTGPRTDSGKAAASRNSLKTGLYAARDFILAGEKDEYEDTLHSLWAHLQPEGVLQETLVSEIMTATWRLRRCGILEAALAAKTDIAADDPDDHLEKQQRSIDRARAQAHRLLHRCTAELRKLQTEEALRNELDARGFNIAQFPGLADSRQLLNALRTLDRHEAKHEARHEAAGTRPSPSSAPGAPHDLESMLALADLRLGMQSTAGISFCKP